MHMSLIHTNVSFLEGDEASLTKLVWERLEPSRWPVSLDDLPKGAALVGGSVRDAFLNKIHHKLDLDLIVPSNAIDLAQKLAIKKSGTCVVLDSQRDIARVVIKEWNIDIASQVGKSLNEDLYRRDFTVNAIALKLGSFPEIVDPQGGIDDLKERKLIAVTKKNLIEDPLRLLRGFRLSAELNLLLDSQTLEFITSNVKYLERVAAERIKVELERLVKGFWADEVIKVIQRIGLLEPWEPHKIHSKAESLSLTNISSLNANEQEIALPLIRLTNLLSDQGLKDLGFSRKKIKDSFSLRYWYQRNDGLAFQTLNENQRIQLHKDLENTMPALILQLPSSEQNIWLSRWRDAQDPLFHPRSPLDGYTLKKIFNAPQGPWIGKLMNFLCKEKAFGRLQNRQDAVQSAFYWWEQNQPLL